MQSEIRQIEQVVRKLQLLPPDRVSEVEDFIDFLSQRGLDQQVVQATMAASQPALSEFGTIPRMPSTTSFEFGDIVLVSFPFASQMGRKKRPAVVVSSGAYTGPM